MNIEVLLESLINSGAITQEDFDKKVKEYQAPHIKTKELMNSIKTPAVRYQEVIENPNSSVEEIRNAKIEELKQLCSEAVYQGFYSESLEKHFGFNEHDQANFSQQILLLIMNSGATQKIEWKTKDAGVVEMSTAEFMELINEAKDHKVSKQARFWELEAQVLDADTKEGITSVEW